MDLIQDIVKHIKEKNEKRNKVKKLYTVDNLDTLYFNNVFSPDKYKLSKMLSVKTMVYICEKFPLSQHLSYLMYHQVFHSGQNLCLL